MKDHITTVVGRYKGRVKGWDVVNEALNDDGTLRNSRWLRIIGERLEEKKYEFIAKAFEYAHQADPDAELYYNDYNLDTKKEKCDGAVKIVKFPLMTSWSIKCLTFGRLCIKKSWRIRLLLYP